MIKITPEMRAELLAAGMPEDADLALQAAWIHRVAKANQEAREKSVQGMRDSWDEQEDAIAADAIAIAEKTVPEGLDRYLLRAVLESQTMIHIMQQRIALLEGREKRLMVLLERTIQRETAARGPALN